MCVYMYMWTWAVGTDNCTSKIIKHEIFLLQVSFIFWENINEGDYVIQNMVLINTKDIP